MRPHEQAEAKLSPVAAAMVEGLAVPTTADALVNRLMAEFDVGRDECERAVAAFLDELAGLGVLETRTGGAPPPLRRRYLDVLKRTLVNLVYAEDAVRLHALASDRLPEDLVAVGRLLRDIRYEWPDTYAEIVATKLDGSVDRFWGARLSHTMIGLSGLDNLERCADRVFAEGVSGDFLEAGACHGGASIFLRALQVAYGEEDRSTWVADTFAGVPPPTHEVDREHELDLTEERITWMASSLDAVRDNFATYDLLSANVRFLPGLFADTLPQAPIERLAILRVDGDLYSSTRDALDSMYDKVSPGGWVIVDDYHALEPCRIATDDFIRERGLDVELHEVDWTRVCWRKSG